MEQSPLCFQFAQSLEIQLERDVSLMIANIVNDAVADGLIFTSSSLIVILEHVASDYNKQAKGGLGCIYCLEPYARHPLFIPTK